MNDRALLVVLVTVAVVAVAPLAAAGGFVEGAPAQEEGATPTPTPDESQATTEITANDSNASLGASVSAFMQSSAAEAEGEVDRGMFAARFNASDEEARDELVRDRAAVLEDRLEKLRAERAALLDDGNTTVAERAKAARLTARIEALQNAVNQTKRAAERANVSLNRTKLLALREAAGDLAGPEIAALATDLVDRPDRGQGPPADRGNRTDDADPGPPDDSGDQGNQTDQGDSGPPDDSGSEDGDDPGPPDDSGDQGNQTDQGDSGPPDDSGDQGNQTDQGDSGSPDDSGSEDGDDPGPPDDSGDQGNQTDQGDPGPPDDSGDGSDNAKTPTETATGDSDGT